MSFLENTRKPTGLGGRIMVGLMNIGHASLAGWGMGFLPLTPDARILDLGCGGGANIAKLLKKCPKGIVKGVDYSAVSVEKARERNRRAIELDRCFIWQGSVKRTIFAADWYDIATAFETVYFWPEPVQCFREAYRILKPGGTFLICNECDGENPKDNKWTERIRDMTIYRAGELQAMLERVGFHDIAIHRHKKGWLCITAGK